MPPRGWKKSEALAGRAKSDRASLDATLAEYTRIKARLDGIEAALHKRGLYAFEHIDGTFSLNTL